MTKPNSGRRSRKQGRAGFPTLKIAIVVGLIAAVSLAVFLASGAKPSNAAQKRYKATREIVVDKQTGQRRLPTQEEIDETVANLNELAARPEDVPETQGVGDAIIADLGGGYGGVMLARPTEDGNWETRCVFTLEEGADFLGLVEDISAE
jgi:hypothetical protein